MNCKLYSDLSIVDKYQLVGKAVHLLQNDQTACEIIKEMVQAAERKGLFEGVAILPEPEQNHIDTPSNIEQ